MRVEFANFAVGAGRVWIHAGASVDGPYTGDGPYGNGEFWSGTISGEAATIEFEPSAGASRREGLPPFQLRRVAHHLESATDQRTLRWTFAHPVVEHDEIELPMFGRWYVNRAVTDGGPATGILYCTPVV